MPRKKHKAGPAEILFYPGLGADLEMYLPVISALLQRRFLFTAVSAENISMESSSESLEHYAERVTRSALPEGHDGKFDLVVGCSLGGMLAATAVKNKVIRTDSLLMLSSALSGSGLTWFSSLSLTVFPLIPRVLRAPLKNTAALLYPVFRFWIRWSTVVASMIRRADADLIFQAPEMISEWKGLHPSELPVRNFFQIHGSADPVLSYGKLRNVRPPDLVIPGGGHILFLTHADTIAEQIIRLCESKDR